MAVQMLATDGLSLSASALLMPSPPHGQISREHGVGLVPVVDSITFSDITDVAPTMC